MNPCLSLCLEGEWAVSGCSKLQPETAERAERSARDWKVRSTKDDAGDFKHELLNRLRSTMAVIVLKYNVVVGSMVWLQPHHRTNKNDVF